MANIKWYLRKCAVSNAADTHTDKYVVDKL